MAGEAVLSNVQIAYRSGGDDSNSGDLIYASIASLRTRSSPVVCAEIGTQRERSYSVNGSCKFFVVNKNAMPVLCNLST